MGGLRELVRRFAPALSPAAAARNDNFLLENGAERLAPFFADVEVERQPNALLVTEAGPLVDYALSLWDYQLVLRGRERDFAAFIAGEIAARGAIRIAKEIGLLTGRRAE